MTLNKFQCREDSSGPKTAVRHKTAHTQCRNETQVYTVRALAIVHEAQAVLLIHRRKIKGAERASESQFRRFAVDSTDKAGQGSLKLRTEFRLLDHSKKSSDDTGVTRIISCQRRCTDPKRHERTLLCGT